MISVVMPYYNRLTQFQEAVKRYPPGLELVVVVDSKEKGNPQIDYPAIFVPGFDWWPAAAINLGLRRSSGDPVVVTNPENLVPLELWQEVEQVPDDAYGCAPCLGDEGWYTHPHFCPRFLPHFAAFRRANFIPRDEQYHPCGWAEDDDWAESYEHSGARMWWFRTPVRHQAHHRSPVSETGKQDNLKRFFEKWGHEPRRFPPVKREGGPSPARSQPYTPRGCK